MSVFHRFFSPAFSAALKKGIRLIGFILQSWWFLAQVAKPLPIDD